MTEPYVPQDPAPTLADGWHLFHTLAERTRQIGYPVSRVAISKIEGNFRAGKLDVGELLALAVALEIPPARLLFPDFPEGTVELLPGQGQIADTVGTVKWLAGNAPLPWTVGHLLVAEVNDGVELVQAVAKRAELDDNLLQAQLIERKQQESKESTQRAIAAYKAELAATKTRIDQAKSQLWGMSGGE